MDVTAVFILSMILLVVGMNAQSIHQTSAPQLVLQGAPVFLECTYKVSGYPSLFWYVQHPGKAPVLLLQGLGREENNGFTAKHEKSNESYHMRKAQAELTDSALYFCAVSDRNYNKYIFGSGTQVTVIPRTSRTIPSVYRLEADKPKEGLPNTVCLVTDFPKPDTTLTVDEKEITLKETSVLDKSTSDVWRYSAVIWDNDNPSKDLSCKVTYDGKDVPQEKNIRDETATACSSLTVNERFSTNPSMNTLSLSVLGLRMLTAKAVIFKLIITLRLWSS